MAEMLIAPMICLAVVIWLTVSLMMWFLVETNDNLSSPERKLGFGEVAFLFAWPITIPLFVISAFLYVAVHAFIKSRRKPTKTETTQTL